MGLSLTLILVIVTGLISYNAFNNRQMYQKLLFHPYTVKKSGEISRFITHGFVHADMRHLGINLFVLYMFGESVESGFNVMFGEAMGRGLFLLIYLGAIIFSSIPTYFKHKDNSYYSAVGASGGTSAIVFASILFSPWAWFIFPPLPAIFVGIGYLVYSSYMGKKGNDNIGHDAHFWGSVWGLVLTIVFVQLLAPDYMQLFIDRLMAGPSAPNF